MTTGRASTPKIVPELHVHTPDGRVFRFVTPFQIGRDHDCDVRIVDIHVSRRHLAGSFEKGKWCLRDLKSANGIFADGERVETASIDGSLTITLGAEGPSLAFAVEGAHSGTNRGAGLPQTIQQQEADTRALASYEERYFGAGTKQDRAGRRTRMIRRAFEQVQRRQRHKHWRIVGVAAAVTLGAVGVALYKDWQVRQQQALAVDMFYAMKALDVDIANVERLVAASGSPQAQAQARTQAKTYLARRRDMESRYDRFVAVRNLYDSKLSEEDRLILRVTRLFGECELGASTEYMNNIKRYIKKWQASPRYERAINQADQMGFTRTIAEEFTAQNLPPQFFYLAMQESDFNPFASGEPTYAGIAKGMWQFIPETAARYGLRVGPLAKQRRPDPGDDRHHWQKETNAAARYIKDIYSTDAQASGLLVMASYNWGEGRVINLLRSMPENPQERNFWKVLEKYRDRVPNQTYDYVFYIVSAAVIGENPRLFGFQFDNPLDSSTRHGLGSPGRVEPSPAATSGGIRSEREGRRVVVAKRDRPSRAVTAWRRGPLNQRAAARPWRSAIG
jgi:membrane-bound lytic murein transglycosylase D